LKILFSENIEKKYRYLNPPIYDIFKHYPPNFATGSNREISQTNTYWKHSGGEIQQALSSNHDTTQINQTLTLLVDCKLLSNEQVVVIAKEINNSVYFPINTEVAK